MLRIAVEAHEVIDVMQHHNLYDAHSESLCFGFDLSIFADEIDHHHSRDNEDNKLIRVDWHGKEQSSGKYDTSSRVTAYLEFEKSLAHHIPALKQTFTENIYLQPLTAQGKPDTELHHVVPSHFKSKF